MIKTSTFQVSDVRLDYFEYKNLPHSGGDRLAAAASYEPGDIKYDSESRCFSGPFGIGMRFILEKSIKNPEDSEFYAEIHISSQITMSDVDEDSRELFRRMFFINGVTTLLPILRGHLAAATAALGLITPLIIPNVNVQELANDFLAGQD